MKIKVLALNDDNHERAYVTLNSYYSNCADFAKDCLLQPHNNEYEVREVYICDPQGALAEMSEDDFIMAFELLEQRPMALLAKSRALYDARNNKFELFWENGEEWRYA